LNPKLVTIYIVEPQAILITYIIEPQAIPTTYIIEPQVSHQRMPICEIETSLAQDDFNFDHTPI
jgi:hypothetical protein